MFEELRICLFFLNEISADMLEEQSREEGYHKLEVEGYIMILDDMKKHWKDVVEGNIEVKGKVRALR